MVFTVTNAAYTKAHAQYTLVEDPEIDDEELDREIRGYDSEDDLEVEVDSDDFEVVGVVYGTSDEESSADEGDELEAQTLPEGEYTHIWGRVYSNATQLQESSRQLHVREALAPGATTDQTTGSMAKPLATAT